MDRPRPAALVRSAGGSVEPERGRSRRRFPRASRRRQAAERHRQEIRGWSEGRLRAWSWVGPEEPPHRQVQQGDELRREAVHGLLGSLGYYRSCAAVFDAMIPSAKSRFLQKSGAPPPTNPAKRAGPVRRRNLHQRPRPGRLASPVKTHHRAWAEASPSRRIFTPKIPWCNLADRICRQGSSSTIFRQSSICCMMALERTPRV